MPLSRWSRRHKRTFGKKKKESKVFLEEHRVPPKPTSYYTEDKGKCRYCGHWIYTEQGETNLRKSWHTKCADEYMFIYHSGETRKYIWKRARTNEKYLRLKEEFKNAIIEMES